MPAVGPGGLPIHYQRFGSGPRLLLCNGSGASIATTAVLIDVLARHFEVAVHDQRGLGRTGLPASGPPPRMADYAADGAAVLDDLGWADTAVLGMSFGGMVAQEFAVTWPARVTRLALLCTSAGGGGGSSYPLHQLAALAPDERRRVQLHNFDTRFTPDWLADHPQDQLLVDLVLPREEPVPSPEAARGFEAQLTARAGHDVWDRLDRIDCPTLVACGRFDGLAPPENAEHLASRIAGSTLRVYEGGHLFAAQDPRALPDVIAFLGQ